MYCTRCGNKLEPTSRFCPACGAAVSNDIPAAQQAWQYTTAPLYRPRTNRMVAGVCAAFAQRYGWDLTVTRILSALLIVCTGVGAIAYIVAWVVIPEEPFALPSKSI